MGAALSVVALGACGPKSDVLPAGQMTATWVGADRGTDRMEAQATLCARDSIIEIFGYRADRGTGVAIHLASATPSPGRFVMLNPNLETIPRPAATGAFRTLVPEGVKGFVTRDGELELTEVVAEGVSGRFTLRMVALSGSDTVALTGAFHRVRVDPAPTPCGRAARTRLEMP